MTAAAHPGPSAAVSIGPAHRSERAEVARLLERCGLPTEGIADDRVTLVVARRGGDVIGCAGVERYGRHVLLRSVAVRGDARGHGLGRRLVDAVLDAAAAGGATDAYLVTTDATGVFARLGFAELDRARLHRDAPAVAASPELTRLCPSDADVLHRRLGPERPPIGRHRADPDPSDCSACRPSACRARPAYE